MNAACYDDDENMNTPEAQDGHVLFFDIDPVTGQITVGARAKLNRDVTDRSNSNQSIHSRSPGH